MSWGTWASLLVLQTSHLGSMEQDSWATCGDNSLRSCLCLQTLASPGQLADVPSAVAGTCYWIPSYGFPSPGVLGWEVQFPGPPHPPELAGGKGRADGWPRPQRQRLSLYQVPLLAMQGCV